MKNNKLNIKSTGFKTPDNYFEKFEDKLFDRLSEKESIEGVDSTGFKVPDDYLEKFDEKLLEHIKNTEDKPVVKFINRKLFYYISGIAASLLLLLVLFNKIDEPMETLSVEMVETYLGNQDLDSYELAQLLSEANILEEDFTIIETNYNEENIESYLLDNADIETILE